MKIKKNTSSLIFKFLKLFIPIIVIVAIFANCEQSDTIFVEEDVGTSLDSGIKIEQISFKELKQDQKIKPYIDEIDRVFHDPEEAGVLHKDVESKDSTFTVLTEVINTIKTDSTETYSFLIEENTWSGSSFENFVIEVKMKNNQVKLFVARFKKNNSGDDFPYDVTREKVYKRQIKNGNFDQFMPEMESFRGWCYQAVPTYNTFYNENMGGGGYYYICSENGGDTSIPTPPDSNGGTGQDGTNSTEPDTTGGGNPNDGTNSDQSDTPATPVTIPCENDCLNCAPCTECDLGYEPKAIGEGCKEIDRIIIDLPLSIEFECQAQIITNTLNTALNLTQEVKDIFDEDNTNYNLVFTKEELLEGTSVMAATSQASIESSWDDDKLDITIGLNPDLLNNATDLALAATIIHESLHGVLLYKLETGHLSVENTTENPTLAILVDAYARHMIMENEFGGQLTVPADDVQDYMHVYMANIIHDIALSISQFGESMGYGLPLSYYTSLAWFGLEDQLELILFLDDDQLDEADELEIENTHDVLIKEAFNQSGAIGTKCIN